MKLYQKIASTISAIQNCLNSGNTTWYDQHKETLRLIERDSLPRGSGFDSGCKIDWENSTENRIIIQADFHAMDENGYYCGWKEYKVIIRPHLAYGMALRVDGRDFNGLKDYIVDVFHNVLNEDI